MGWAAVHKHRGPGMNVTSPVYGRPKAKAQGAINAFLNQEFGIGKRELPQRTEPTKRPQMRIHIRMHPARPILPQPAGSRREEFTCECILPVKGTGRRAALCGDHLYHQKAFIRQQKRRLMS